MCRTGKVTVDIAGGVPARTRRCGIGVRGGARVRALPCGSVFSGGRTLGGGWKSQRRGVDSWQHTGHDCRGGIRPDRVGGWAQLQGGSCIVNRPELGRIAWQGAARSSGDASQQNPLSTHQGKFQQHHQ